MRMGLGIVWTSENDRKLLIRLIERSAKSYDTVELAKLFPGATPKAIEERIAKLKREAKAMDNPSANTTSSSKNRKRGTTAATAAAGAGAGGVGGKKRPKTNTTVPLFVPGVCGGDNDDEEGKKRFAGGIASADVGRDGVLAGVGESTEDGGGEEVPVDVGPVSPGVEIGMGLGDIGVVKPDPWVKEELAMREMQEPYVENNPVGLIGGLIVYPEGNWPIKPEMAE
ncbi:hypothetical protein C7212DRAFT_348071 [Tuber magnatum]|uniref:Myb-like domain-containing protein n=2 Tax=Tuberaceae TaxID=40289 RepID=A0A317SE36_9PEZI|nr:hypothetical protein C7212DRAFT_348071 [Tuber magnatum]